MYDDGEGGGYAYVRLYKCVAGSWTQLGGTWQANSSAETFPVWLKLEVSGTSLSVKSASSHGGTYTERITATDSAIASGSPGVYGDQPTWGMDNFYAGDL
jgi:hypothetical protein